MSVMTSESLAASDKELNELILEGKALDAFERFYDDEVVMRDNDDEGWAGKETNRKREEEFFASVAEVHELSLTGAATSDDTSFSEWVYDITFANGHRAKWTQAAVRRWKNGRIVSETFYHAPMG